MVKLKSFEGQTQPHRSHIASLAHRCVGGFLQEHSTQNWRQQGSRVIKDVPAVFH